MCIRDSKEIASKIFVLPAPLLPIIAMGLPDNSRLNSECERKFISFKNLIRSNDFLLFVISIFVSCDNLKWTYHTLIGIKTYVASSWAESLIKAGAPGSSRIKVIVSPDIWEAISSKYLALKPTSKSSAS